MSNSYTNNLEMNKIITNESAETLEEFSDTDSSNEINTNEASLCFNDNKTPNKMIRSVIAIDAESDKESCCSCNVDEQGDDSETNKNQNTNNHSELTDLKQQFLCMNFLNKIIFDEPLNYNVMKSNKHNEMKFNDCANMKTKRIAYKCNICRDSCCLYTLEGVFEQHILYDNIHGRITISKAANHIINHRYFDRLKHIKQLGPLHFRFLHVNGSRYEHSVGTGYLARYTGLVLQSKHNTITEKEILCLEIAGLCHDLGHGAYSHSFDHMLRNIKFPHNTAHHEIRSQVLVEYLIKDIEPLYKLLGDSYISLVQYFIDPEKYVKNFNKPLPLYTIGLEQIVSNPLHKLDVDKMDYLLRDAQSLRFDLAMDGKIDVFGLINRSTLVVLDIDIENHIDVQNHINAQNQTDAQNHTALQNHLTEQEIFKQNYTEQNNNYEQSNTLSNVLSNVLSNTVSNTLSKKISVWAFHIRDKIIVYDLICKRFIFYNNYYLHPHVNALNCMLTDALTNVNKIYNFAECVALKNNQDVEKYIELTDKYFIEFILNSSDRRIKQAIDLFEKIINFKDKANWYQHMGDFVTHVDGLDETAYVELPWEIFTDKSTPTNLLPKIKYHQNGILVDQKSVTHVRRLYLKTV